MGRVKGLKPKSGLATAITKEGAVKMALKNWAEVCNYNPNYDYKNPVVKELKKAAVLFAGKMKSKEKLGGYHWVEVKAIDEKDAKKQLQKKVRPGYTLTEIRKGGAPSERGLAVNFSQK